MVSKKFNIPVSAFSSVMGMEISSIAFHFHGLVAISEFLEYLGLIVYVFLVLYFVFMPLLGFALAIRENIFKLDCLFIAIITISIALAVVSFAVIVPAIYGIYCCFYLKFLDTADKILKYGLI